MPKLRRLSGQDIVRILIEFGFEVVRIRGSHHILRRTITIDLPSGDKQTITQTVNVPVHGNQPLATGMLQRLFKDICRYVPEDKLRTHFYSD